MEPLSAAMIGADRITTWAEDRFYGDNVVLRESSDYQRIVVTSGHAGVRLYLNGNLQFHSRDEYRYHEALVHPAMAAHGAPRRVLVLGGGDGMAVREVLKHASVEQVTLVELDPRIEQGVEHRDRGLPVPRLEALACAIEILGRRGVGRAHQGGKRELSDQGSAHVTSTSSPALTRTFFATT